MAGVERWWTVSISGEQLCAGVLDESTRSMENELQIVI